MHVCVFSRLAHRSVNSHMFKRLVGVAQQQNWSVALIFKDGYHF